MHDLDGLLEWTRCDEEGARNQEPQIGATDQWVARDLRVFFGFARGRRRKCAVTRARLLVAYIAGAHIHVFSGDVWAIQVPRVCGISHERGRQYLEMTFAGNWQTSG